jgi:hypothetical protein
MVAADTDGATKQLMHVVLHGNRGGDTRGITEH